MAAAARPENASLAAIVVGERPGQLQAEVWATLHQAADPSSAPGTFSVSRLSDRWSVSLSPRRGSAPVRSCLPMRQVLPAGICAAIAATLYPASAVMGAAPGSGAPERINGAKVWSSGDTVPSPDRRHSEIACFSHRDLVRRMASLAPGPITRPCRSCRAEQSGLPGPPDRRSPSPASLCCVGRANLVQALRRSSARRVWVNWKREEVRSSATGAGR